MILSALIGLLFLYVRIGCVFIVSFPGLSIEYFAIQPLISFRLSRIPKSFTKLLDGFCKELVIWYGSTEANGVSVFMSHDPDMFEDGIIGTPQSGEEL